MPLFRLLQLLARKIFFCEISDDVSKNILNIFIFNLFNRIVKIPWLMASALKPVNKRDE